MGCCRTSDAKRIDGSKWCDSGKTLIHHSVHGDHRVRNEVCDLRRTAYCTPGIFASVAIQLLLVLSVLMLPVAAQRSPGRDAGTRPCKGFGADATAGKKSTKQNKKNAGQAETSSGAACLEVHSSTLDVQEHLQAFVREQHWRVGSEETSESLWNFNRELSAEELLNYARPDATQQRVHWKAGKAVILVRTTDVGDGYTRTVVSAQFEGYGESEDKFATQRESWTLSSRGRLEATLIGALQKNYGAEN